MKRINLVLAMLTIVTGCTSAGILSQFSAGQGQVPCRAKDIIITEETEEATLAGKRNWIAECKGKKYTCNSHYGNEVKCMELNP